MSPRSTGILALVAIALGAFVYFYEIEGEQGRNATEEAERRIFSGLEEGSIEAIELETQDFRSARFVRTNGLWDLVEPVNSPADAASLDAMSAVLVQLSRAGRVDAPGPLDEYGLGEAARLIRFEVDGEDRGLRIGRRTPVGGHLYVATLSSDAVFFVESFRINAFNRNLDDLRDRRILPIESAAVTEISLKWRGGEVDLEKREDDWWVVSPVIELADASTVRDLLDDLSYLRAQSFVDDEDESTAEKMAEVAFDVRLTHDGSESRATFGASVGRDPSAGESRLVRGRDEQLFQVAPERFEDFERTLSAYRFRTLSAFDGSSARKIIIDFGDDRIADEPTADSVGDRIEMRLDGPHWRSTDDVSIESEEIQALIQELSQLRATTVVADEMGIAERTGLGLTPPRIRFRVESEMIGEGEADLLADVSLGLFDAQRGIYAQRSGDSKIYLLDPVLAESLPVGREAFNERFVSKSAVEEAVEEMSGEEFEDAEQGASGRADDHDPSAAEGGLILDLEDL